MTVIERLEKRLKIAKEGIAIMELDARYQNGVKDGLASAINELKADSPVMDSQFKEVSNTASNLVLTIGEHRADIEAFAKVYLEAIAFIEELAEIWGRSDDQEIHRQMLWHRENTVYQFARGIIKQGEQVEK